MKISAKAKRINVQIVTSDLQNLQKLAKGRIDLFPATLVTGSNLILNHLESASAKLITHHPQLLAETKGHLLFPKIRPESIELRYIFNKGLQKIKEEGLYYQLVSNLLSGQYNK